MSSTTTATATPVVAAAATSPTTATAAPATTGVVLPSPVDLDAPPATVDSKGQPIQRFAVYGTLRDDDDSKRPWTAPFIKGLDEASSGRVYGARIHNTSRGYPIVLYTEDPKDFVHVRLLHWRDRAAWEQKLIDADKIEGYDPKQPTAGVYMRRVVAVTPYGEGEPATAYMYVCSPKQAPEPDWRVIPSGDWLQRHTVPVPLRESAAADSDLPVW